MTITLFCSKCGHRQALADEYAGREVRCPKCKQRVALPGSATPSRPPGATPQNIDPAESKHPSQPFGEEYEDAAQPWDRAWRRIGTVLVVLGIGSFILPLFGLQSASSTSSVRRST